MAGHDWQVWYAPKQDEIVLARLAGIFYDYKYSNGIQFSYWSPETHGWIYIGEFEE